MEDSKPPRTAQHVLQMGRLGTGAIDAILARNNADQTQSTPKGRSHTRFHRLYKVSCAERQHGHWHGPGIEARLRSRCTHWPGPAQTWPPTQGRPAARTRTRRGHRPLAGSSRSDGLGACTEAAARPALGCSGLSGHTPGRPRHPGGDRGRQRTRRGHSRFCSSVAEEGRRILLLQEVA